MSSQRQARKKKQGSYDLPFNFTCGVCKQVHKSKDGRFLCVNPLFITAEQLAKRTEEEQASGDT